MQPAGSSSSQLLRSLLGGSFIDTNLGVRFSEDEAAISALFWTHSLLLWPLYVLAFCFGVTDAFAVPAAQTYLPSLVVPQQLASANALFQSTVQVTTLVAPAPAALFIKAFGTA